MVTLAMRLLVPMLAIADPGNPHTVDGVCINHHVRCGCPATPPCATGATKLLYLDEPSWTDIGTWTGDRFGYGDGFKPEAVDEGPAKGPSHISASSSFNSGEPSGPASKESADVDPSPDSSTDPSPTTEPATSLVSFTAPETIPEPAPETLPDTPTFVQNVPMR